MVSVCLPSDALLQHLPSYLGFSYLGRGVSLHSCSSKVKPLLLTLDEVEGCCKQITLVCARSLSHTGPAPTHGTCALPAHTAQALGCSPGNRPRPALGCMHLPGLSLSGSGTRVVLRGADFMPFPGPSSLGHELFGERGHCDLPPLPSLLLGFLGV